MSTFNAPFVLVCGLAACAAQAQTAIEVEGPSIEGVLHDNVSNQQRQGSGFTPLILKSFPTANLYRDDAVGMNFEHIFNGAREQVDISMFTPRRDPCSLSRIDEYRYQLHWPSEESRWGLDARMIYDLAEAGQIDLEFECSPTVALYPQDFAAMMWASYMNRAIDRRIHFWGTEGDRTGWVTFGEGMAEDIETGTVSHAAAADLPYEGGAQTLNLIEHPDKKFITPFYYGLIDGDHDLQTTDDRLLYLVLFDQTESIRFAMWNFFRNESNEPDTHSPAWDWQFVVRNPEVGETYGYRARIVVKPFEGTEHVWDEYQRWIQDTEAELPDRP